MRKRYSRSYTVLSFLTMFSYREQPSCPSFFGEKILFTFLLQLGHHFFVDENAGNTDYSHPGKDQDGG